MRVSDTYSFNIDFESAKGIVGVCRDLLGEVFDSLLFKEFLNRWFSNFTVVGSAIGLKTPLHVL